MVWECDCGQSGTNKYFFVINKYTCPLCNGLLKEKKDFSLSFWSKHESFIDLDEDYLNPKRKQVLDAIKINQPCSDRDIAKFLDWDRCQVTGRRFELANCSIPFIIDSGKKFDDETKKQVTLWKINKIVDVEREMEVRT